MKPLDFDKVFQEKISRLLYQDDGFAAAAVDYLKPELFANPVHRWIVKKVAWCHHVLGYHITKTILVQEWHKDRKLGLIKEEQYPLFREFLAQRINRPVPDKTYIKGEVQQFIKNQHFEQFLLWAAEDGLPNHKFSEIDQRMADLAELDVTGSNSVGVFVGKTYKDRKAFRSSAVVVGLTTGLPGIDSLMTNGGLEPGQLGCILGSTGKGKSNILINISAANVMEGVPTVYYTCELPSSVIETRMDARFTNIPIRLLKRASNEYDSQWAKVEGVVGPNLVVKEYPMGTLTVSMIKAHLKQLERHGFYPKLLVIDYADVMSSSVVFADSSYETQGQIYKDLKGLAMALKLAIWTGTQSNRAGMADDDNDVDLSKIADSAKKAFIADVVLGLNQTKKEKLNSMMRVSVLKNRNGPAEREVLVKVDHAVCRFMERARESVTAIPPKVRPKKPTEKHHEIQSKIKENSIEAA